MKVFIIGMPGSGKSTLGKQVARLMKLDFFDLDHEIEQLIRTSIAEVFLQQGEAYFRELERDTLDKLIHEHENFVLATGGGTPCFHENMEAMNRAGLTVFINVSTREIISRMSKKGLADRPLFHDLNVQNMEKEFDKKFSHRIPCYKQANIEIAGDHVTPERIVHLVSFHPKS